MLWEGLPAEIRILAAVKPLTLRLNEGDQIKFDGLPDVKSAAKAELSCYTKRCVHDVSLMVTRLLIALILSECR